MICLVLIFDLKSKRDAKLVDPFKPLKFLLRVRMASEIF